MKKINKSSLSALLIIFGFFLMTLNFWDNPATTQPIFTEDGETNESLPNTSQFVPRNIRVAIYDEPNITVPSYAIGSNPFLDNNYTGLLQLLQGAGYQVDELTCDDIYNHKLMTADYDVFIMVDNLPKVNITDYVKEFWLGGGAILSFDNAIVYLCYYGILIPESEGFHGLNTYYHYTSDTSHNISSRHPTTKDYEVNDKFSSIFASTAYLTWDVLLGTSVGSEVVKLANRDGSYNSATAVALERDDKGGRIVQLPGRGDTIGINMSSLILDAIDWLCPRPKGRILFDLSHLNGFGVDLWDNPFVYSTDDRFTIMRNNLVNRSYTFDKLYPSALGNFTTGNLAPYDLLILNLPQINFTASEVTNIRNWVNNGGGILALGDKYYYDGVKNLNYLLSSFDLLLIDEYGTTPLTTSFEHPTEEGCSSITMAATSVINYTGNAYPLWGSSPTEICIAGKEYGNGRVILTSDVNLFDNSRIGLTDNLQYSINVANWLTASQAKVLVLVTDHGNPDPNDNVYKGPVATALNDLGIKFYLAFTCHYFNLSLTNNDFKLVIVDRNYGGGIYGFIDDYASDVINYMENGGRIIIRSNRQLYASPLWDYLGYSYEGHLLTTPPVVYIWNAGHRIFTTPAHYSANNITTSLNAFGTDFVNVTLYSNATGIAGLTNISSVDSNAIILGVNGRAISNTFGITEYYDDTDDSTYPDALEIWENEIAYMLYQTLSVGINNPHTSDIFNATAPDFSITTGGIIIDKMYHTLNDGTNSYIYSTSGTINQGAWDALPDGAVSLKFYVEDTAGSFKYQGVNIVKDSQGPNITITSPSAGDTFGATALSFIVEITDEHLDKMWYTLNSSSTKYFFTTNSSIDQSVWDTLADGSITIRFYANDTVSNEAFATVSVEISTGGNGGPGGIPGYNSYILIGVIFVISAIIVKRQLKQNKFKN